MNDDLVQELKDLSVLWPNGVATRAADRIEKLEAALQAIIRYAGNGGDDYLADQARKALDQQNKSLQIKLDMQF